MDDWCQTSTSWSVSKIVWLQEGVVARTIANTRKSSCMSARGVPPAAYPVRGVCCWGGGGLLLSWFCPPPSPRLGPGQVVPPLWTNWKRYLPVVCTRAVITWLNGICHWMLWTSNGDGRRTEVPETRSFIVCVNFHEPQDAGWRYFWSDNSWTPQMVSKHLVLKSWNHICQWRFALLKGYECRPYSWLRSVEITPGSLCVLSCMVKQLSRLLGYSVSDRVVVSECTHWGGAV